MTDPKNPKSDDSTTEELTAYLDGELAPEAMQRVELRLGNDAEYRVELQALQKTWDLLDTIPLAEPGTSFTKTTMELIVGDAVQAAKKKQGRSWVWPLRIAFLIALPLVAFAAVFAIVRDFQTKPDRILIENLSIIENQPRYDSITYDMEFLKQLTKRDLFGYSKVMVDEKGELVGIESTDETKLVPDAPEDREAYVESLNVQQRVKLKRKLENFQKLSAVLLQKTRQFDERLSSMKNSAQLAATLTAYYDWLMEIDSGEVSRLRDLDAAQRIKAIAAIRYRQSLDQFGKDALAKLASPDDAAPILAWSEIVFNLKEQQIRRRFPQALAEHAKSQGHPTPPSQIIRRISNSGSLPALVDELLRVDRSFVEDLILGDREKTEMLYDMLSRNAQKQMDERSIKQRNELVLNWVESANQSKQAVSIEILKRFKKQLPAKERDRLDKMSTEESWSTLKQMFLERRKSTPTKLRPFEQELEELMNF